MFFFYIYIFIIILFLHLHIYYIIRITKHMLVLNNQLEVIKLYIGDFGIKNDFFVFYNRCFIKFFVVLHYPNKFSFLSVALGSRKIFEAINIQYLYSKYIYIYSNIFKSYLIERGFSLLSVSVSLLSVSQILRC